MKELEKFETPVIEVIIFKTEDVITASDIDEDDENLGKWIP